jgi:hypothetical protein
MNVIDFLKSNADVAHNRAQKCQQEMKYYPGQATVDGSKYAAINATSAEYEYAMAIDRGDE